MSLKLVVFLASAAGLVGIALGYYLRLIISLGKKGSMELEIKEMMLRAKEGDIAPTRIEQVLGKLGSRPIRKLRGDNQ